MAKTLADLFHDLLKEIYYAEKKIISALPKMAEAAQSEELKATFAKHLEETKGQVQRLEEVFEMIGAEAEDKTCEAIDAIINEGADVMNEYNGAPALDSGLLAAAQAVEHYEIARYGTLRTWAGELRITNAVALLPATLEEENATDKTLTAIAEAVANQEAKAA
jgi:ferritin-like metal-binding protein YciE